MTKDEIKLVMQWCLPLDTANEKLNELVEVFANEHKEAINYSQCCTELICDFDNINDGSLTKGKKYAKIHEHNGMVVIINDFDEVMSYNKEAFFEAN